MKQQLKFASIAFAGAVSAISLADDTPGDTAVITTSEHLAQFARAKQFLTEVCINDHVSEHQEEFEAFEEMTWLLAGRTAQEACEEFVHEIEIHDDAFLLMEFENYVSGLAKDSEDSMALSLA